MSQLTKHVKMSSDFSPTAQFLPFPPDYELPEMDGSAVDETCRIFVVDPSEDTPEPSSTIPITTSSTRTNRKVKRTPFVYWSSRRTQIIWIFINRVWFHSRWSLQLESQQFDPQHRNQRPKHQSEPSQLQTATPTWISTTFTSSWLIAEDMQVALSQ